MKKITKTVKSKLPSEPEEQKPAQPEQPKPEPRRGGASWFVPPQKPSGFGVKGE